MLALGAADRAWLATLDGLVRNLADEWGLSVGRVLPGGTEAFVAEAGTANAREWC